MCTLVLVSSCSSLFDGNMTVSPPHNSGITHLLIIFGDLFGFHDGEDDDGDCTDDENANAILSFPNNYSSRSVRTQLHIAVADKRPFNVKKVQNVHLDQLDKLDLLHDAGHDGKKRS